jgi:four helix bundle protein
VARHYKDHIAWQKAIELVAEIYKITDQFPRREVYSLTDQIRRAAVSVPSNIAEGQAHFNNGEFLHFLRHARGPLAELETQMIIAERLKYISATELCEILRKIDEISRIASGLVNSIKGKPLKQPAMAGR